MSVSAASPVTVNVSESVSVSVSVSVSASVPGRWSHQQQAQGSLAGLARQWALPSTELTAQTQSWAWRHPLQKCHTPAFAHTCNCEKRKEKGREGKGREGKGREGKGREGKGREGEGREGKTAPVGVSVMRSQVLYWAAQGSSCYRLCRPVQIFLHLSRQAVSQKRQLLSTKM